MSEKMITCLRQHGANTKTRRARIRTTTALPHIVRRTVIPRLLPGD